VTDTEVLIAGAGPVGLTAADELRGQRVYLNGERVTHLHATFG
jgi:2-polyprenyl-6-methoxyphenol hydroxylase-like FAD-dependent oxidoreductase